MVGKLVEVSLKDGRSFLGVVRDKDSDGLTVFGVFTKYLEEEASYVKGRGGDLAESLVCQTLFFPYANVDSVCIDDPPGQFEVFYGRHFSPRTVREFFGV